MPTKIRNVRRSANGSQSQSGRRRTKLSRATANISGTPTDLARCPSEELPTCSVVICTRNRPDDLALCLDSVVRLGGQSSEVIVVDNAPSNTATEKLVKQYTRRYGVRYELEERAGLDIARNRGVQEASGEIIAFTDDDCIVDEYWVDSLLQNYSEPNIGCVTGMVAPWEVETRAQELFEFCYGGMSKGLKKLSISPFQIPITEAGRVGCGANMSFRKAALHKIGLFNEALDCGMPTEAGGDVYAFYKTLRAGHRIIYEPSALVWHRHRRDDEQLKKQMYGYGVGIMSFLTACLVEDHDLSALRRMWIWMRCWELERLYQRMRGQIEYPFALIIVDILGYLKGPWAYFKAKRVAERSRLAVRGQVASQRHHTKPNEARAEETA